MIEFTIPGELPAMNEIVEASKSHHMRYSSMKKQYTNLAAWSAKKAKLPEIGHADFEIIWYCKNKRKDKDNIMAGQKFIFDGLVTAGVLANDGWAQIGNVTHEFAVDKQNPRVVVKILDKNSEFVRN